MLSILFNIVLNLDNFKFFKVIVKKVKIKLSNQILNKMIIYIF